MTKNVLALGFIAIVSLPVAARASLLTGELNFTGSATISFASIAFDDGNIFNINPADTQMGSFAVLGGTDGSIDNITNPPDATGVPLNVPDFITFAAAPNISITLTDLLPGIDGAAGCADTPPASGQQCTPDTPAQSPFNLENTSATSSTASFNILGIEVDSLTGDTIPITGAFTTPFTSMNFQQLLAEVATPGGSITTSFSGEIATVAVAPEPTTFIDLLTGIIALGICSGYRRKSAKN
jgi:hypothetical protein